MTIQFNYRYYLDDSRYETHQLKLTERLGQYLAYEMKDVGDVINFAEQQQKEGKYVALYMTYEAAQYFNPDMAVHPTADDAILAAAYSYQSAQPIQQETSIKHYNNKPQHQFAFQVKEATMIQHIKAVQAAIIDGETYQVNYTTRVSSPVQMPIKDLYDKLTQTKNGNYTMLMDTEDVQVASISPELFFQKGPFDGQDNVVVSKPMKGTMPRSDVKQQDQYNYKYLQQSLKDRAENVMIVDLLRNDIARIARKGTVHVYRSFFIETYATVYQMTSMVAGQLSNATLPLATLFHALFPCGSITGAPKLNTMSYIHKLEDQPRYIYCGTLGILMPDDKMIFNVPIRTIEYRDNKAIYGVGAGITIDSDPENEVQEFRDKAKILEML
ncbi:anthranilate synthase component I family protein [Staphylococcus lugdunensis]|uniref:chorismate-binding protein n=1 Tax=Staphylococcus TaxID=1279 RepID=UPI0008A2AA0E|nr:MULTISPECIES: anthranilate synthase component I family protein [Staphylococcus]ARJ14625.1 aminodeoxychorismate synthase component I [Staphylococcus lugdunensis]MCH8665836.1 anthranilate synthase component I family protein [Staphylococcus lugdunensis]OFJ65000.1 aminobenzoate synthetase [Staphylococcus sp. HMSC077E11]OFM42499.1 aminobenzoate synthetase [Staphylococcus sp. HMSC077E12]OFR90207.1 aminobenzoate synthetase [Staphylococcus sp. HMSC059F04]